MDFDAIVIGSGFRPGDCCGVRVSAGKEVLVLEREAWWVSPIGLARPAGSRSLVPRPLPAVAVFTR